MTISGRFGNRGMLRRLGFRRWNKGYSRLEMVVAGVVLDNIACPSLDERYAY